MSIFKDFHPRHIPALFAASAQCWGTLYALLVADTPTVMMTYGLPSRIVDVPETWPVWDAGGARTTTIGVLMWYFYARRRYDVLDDFLVIIGIYLGVADFIIFYRLGMLGTGLFRLVGSLLMAAMGAAGVTQGRLA